MINKVIHAIAVLSLWCCFSGTPPSAERNSKNSGNIPITATDSLAWKVGDAGKCAGSRIVVDGDENVYVAGWFEGTVNFSDYALTSKGESDIFLAKYNPSGVLQWVKTASGPLREYLMGLCVDAKGNIYLTGHFFKTIQLGNITLRAVDDSDVFLAKYSAQGDLQWAQRTGGQGSDGASDVAITRRGDLYVVGNFAETGTPQPPLPNIYGTGHVFIALYTSQGKLQWIRQGTGTGFSWCLGVAVDERDNAYVTGKFHQDCHFGAVKLPAAYQSQDPRISKGFLVKCSPKGVFEWGLPMGGNKSAHLSNVAADGRGHLFVSGAGFLKDTDAAFGGIPISPDLPFSSIISRVTPAGKVLWVKNTIATGPVQGNMAIDQHGKLLALTSFGNENHGPGTTIEQNNTLRTLVPRGDTDFAVVRFNGQGEIEGVRQLGGDGSEGSTGMALAKSGSLYMLGTFRGTTTLAGSILTPTEDFGTFVLKVHSYHR